MKNLYSKNLVSIGFILILSGLFSSGYSQKKSNESQPNGGIKLEYKYTEGKNFKYVNETKIVQDMDVNGQSMLVNVGIYMKCELKATGREAENLKLAITVDTMAQNIESPQGIAGGTISDVKGKSFNMIISPAGKTIDYSEASKIVFTIEGSGESSLAQSFLNYFPSLPSNAIKPGDTWIINDTVDNKTPNNTVWMPVESNYKFEGIESVDGIDCAKISATLSGTRKMNTQAQGMSINTSGPFTGTQIMLIAVKEGYLVKESIDTKMTGNIDIPDQNMSFPVVMTITTTKEIAKQ
jgi:hypothetical protein